MVSPGKEQQEQTQKKGHQYKTTGNNVQPFWTRLGLVFFCMDARKEIETGEKYFGLFSALKVSWGHILPNFEVWLPCFY